MLCIILLHSWTSAHYTFLQLLVTLQTLLTVNVRSFFYYITFVNFRDHAYQNCKQLPRPLKTVPSPVSNVSSNVFPVWLNSHRNGQPKSACFRTGNMFCIWNCALKSLQMLCFNINATCINMETTKKTNYSDHHKQQENMCMTYSTAIVIFQKWIIQQQGRHNVVVFHSWRITTEVQHKSMQWYFSI